MTIFSHDDVKVVRAKASAALHDALRKSSACPVLFLVSGGSTLSLVHTIDVALVKSNWTFGVLDERYSTDPSINNFAQVAATPFYAKAIERGSKEAVACCTNAAKRQRLRRGCAGGRRGAPDGVHMEGAAR